MSVKESPIKAKAGKAPTKTKNEKIVVEKLLTDSPPFTEFPMMLKA